jgi:hypothetical protein
LISGLLGFSGLHFSFTDCFFKTFAHCNKMNAAKRPYIHSPPYLTEWLVAELYPLLSGPPAVVGNSERHPGSSKLMHVICDRENPEMQVTATFGGDGSAGVKVGKNLQLQRSLLPDVYFPDSREQEFLRETCARVGQFLAGFEGFIEYPTHDHQMFDHFGCKCRPPLEREFDMASFPPADTDVVRAIELLGIFRPTGQWRDITKLFI